MEITNKNILCWFYIYNTDISNNRNITGIVIIKNLITKNPNDNNLSKTVTYFIYCTIEVEDGDGDQNNEFINNVIDNNIYSKITQENAEKIAENKIVIQEYSNESLKEFLIKPAK